MRRRSKRPGNERPGARLSLAKTLRTRGMDAGAAEHQRLGFTVGALAEVLGAQGARLLRGQSPAEGRPALPASDANQHVPEYMSAAMIPSAAAEFDALTNDAVAHGVHFFTIQAEGLLVYRPRVGHRAPPARPGCAGRPCRGDRWRGLPRWGVEQVHRRQDRVADLVPAAPELPARRSSARQGDERDARAERAEGEDPDSRPNRRAEPGIDRERASAGRLRRSCIVGRRLAARRC